MLSDGIQVARHGFKWLVFSTKLVRYLYNEPGERSGSSENYHLPFTF